VQLIQKEIVIILCFIILCSSFTIVGTTKESFPDESIDLIDDLKFDAYCRTEQDQSRYEFYAKTLLNHDSNSSDCNNVNDNERYEPVLPGITDYVVGNDGLLDSCWPMKSHDPRHTGRSPYSTAYNTGEELWRFETDGWIEGGSCIGNDGTVYIGSYFRVLYALNPNGTLKWKYKTDGLIWSCPALAEDGTIYIGSYDDFLYAINPDGTLKWKFWAGTYASITSSPAIALDGTIYFGAMGPNLEEEIGCIYAVNPDGSEKWHYDTGYWIVSDPAIGDDGTVYIGSGDGYLYALWPDGTLRWRFKTGVYVKSHPAIADDGTIYFDSFDGHLYALNPNGSMKWKVDAGGSSSAGVAISEEGVIYDPGKYYLTAWYPNGTRKWQFSLGNNNPITHASPAISAEGTIYIGAGKYIIAINPNGTEQWRQKIANNWVRSSPCIGRDGTVYIGSSSEDEDGYSYGYLYAFGTGLLQAFANGPYYGLTDQSMQFTGEGSGGHQPYTWLWDFGDDHMSNEQQPVHTYDKPGNYTVTLTVTDNEGNCSMDTTWVWIQETNDPPLSPVITGTDFGQISKCYEYTFSVVDPEDNPVYLFVDWDDGTANEWIGPYDSGELVNLSHKWNEKGIYNLRIKAKDVYGSESEWESLSVMMPKNKDIMNVFKGFILRLYEQYPFLSHIVQLFFNGI